MMDKRIEDLDREAERDESATSTGSWWARRATAEKAEVATDADPEWLIEERRVTAMRRELRSIEAHVGAGRDLTDAEQARVAELDKELYG